MPMAAGPAQVLAVLERTASLDHHARGTPREGLIWIAVLGRRWCIDWQRTDYVHAPLIDMPKEVFKGFAHYLPAKATGALA